MTRGVEIERASPANVQERSGGRTRALLCGGLLLLAFLGFLVAMYLTLVHFRGEVPRCYVVQGCDVVQTSKYASIAGVPIALLGTLYFAVMFYLVIAVFTTRAVWPVWAYKILSYAGALAAIPLFLIQAVVLRAFCTYCLVVEVLLLLNWGMSFLVALPLPAGWSGRGASRREARRKTR